jgi:cysteine-rich repeat protein
MKQLTLFFAVSVAAFSGCGMPQVDGLHPACASDEECHALGAAFSGHRCDVALGQCVLDRCGNGEVDRGEACDDGNTTDADGCTGACELAVCGDGLLRSDLTVGQVGFEACDDGNTVAEDGCTTECSLPECGDGFLWAGHEACDDGNRIDDDACSNACRSSTCGDGIVQDGEACDDGNLVNEDACTNECFEATCGDGFVRTGIEACDDGNDVNDDDCTNSCSRPGCGDGVLQDGEACDDGNQRNTDACTDACIEAVCGDGVLRTDLSEGDAGYEACDDNNTVDTDACRGDCSAEARCGDGVTRTDLPLGDEGYEACDGGEHCAAGCRLLPSAVAAGGSSTCAIMGAGEVSCWGGNTVNQLGNPDFDAAFVPQPVPVVGLTRITKIDVGWSHACATDGTDLWCWGGNGSKQLGVATPIKSATPIQTPLPAGEVHAVSAGYVHTCAIIGDNRTLYCWGNGQYGRLGNNSDNHQTAPVRVVQMVTLPRGGTVPQPLTDVTAVAAGHEFTCANRPTGSPPNQHYLTYCWGRNERYQLGVSSRVPLSQLNSAHSNTYLTLNSYNVTVGNRHVCVRTGSTLGSGQFVRNKAVSCWGDHQHKQLGIGFDAVNDDRSITPRATSWQNGTADKRSIRAGGNTTCGRSGYELYCWGDNSDHQAGSEFSTYVYAPEAVSGTNGMIGYDLGDQHTCVLLGDRSIQCFGANDHGELGRGQGGASAWEMAPVVGMTGENG